jgi:hypothetical protein
MVSLSLIGADYHLVIPMRSIETNHSRLLLPRSIKSIHPRVGSKISVELNQL